MNSILQIKSSGGGKSDVFKADEASLHRDLEQVAIDLQQFMLVSSVYLLIPLNWMT
jgi:hypothetical protein